MEIGLSLGSNLGDRLANLRAARQGVLSLPDVTGLAQSRVYETEPVGVAPAHRDETFLNAVIVIDSPTPVTELVDRFHALEAHLGRRRTDDRYAPRPADIDIVYAGTLTFETPALTIPHPRWKDRRFVVQPLADVRPDLIIPGESKPVRDVLLTLPPRPNVVLFCKDW